jgi:polar amino acid transport system substrate-binding protein
MKMALILLALISFGRVAQALPQRGPSPFAKEGEITFCTEVGSLPASFIGEDGTTPMGFEVDLMHAIGQALRMRTNIRIYEFASIFAALDSAKCDAAMAQLSKNPSRSKSYNFVDYAQFASGVLVQNNDPEVFRSFLDLSGHRVAVLLGTANNARLIQANATLATVGKKPIEIVMLRSESFAYQELLLKRVDAYVGGSMTLSYYLNESKGALKWGGLPIPPQTYGILLPKFNIAGTKAVQSAVTAVIKSGKIRSIVAKWGVQKGVFPCDGSRTC